MRYRSTVAVINLPNIYENYKSVSKMVNDKIVIPVVKANAYGHGAIEVTSYLHSKGVDYFAVSLLEEALELREKFPDIDILCMGVVEKEGLLIAIEKSIVVTICNSNQIEYLTKVNEFIELVHKQTGLITKIEDSIKTATNSLKYQTVMKKYLEQNNIPKQLHELLSNKQNMLLLLQILKNRDFSINLNVHLKIDTGMNRLGFKFDDEIRRSFEMLKNIPLVSIQGIYTHFSTADVDKSYYDIQMNRFKKVMEMLDYSFEMVHISNSSSQIKYEKDIDFTTHTRLGISLYGLTLDKDTEFLCNTFQLKTKISQLKNLSSGDCVGYGATYTASSDETIGILPIGYADGFIRKNQGGFVEINGKKYEIVGRICMDQCFIKVDDSVTLEDDVILFGGKITIDEVAKRLDTINYEVICQITNRVPREYIK